MTEPTYITEHSSSLPVIGLLHHSSKPSTSYQRKILLYDKGDFDSYRNNLQMLTERLCLDMTTQTQL